MNAFDTVAVMFVVQSLTTLGANYLRGMQGWGWRIPAFIFLLLGLLVLVLDSGFFTIFIHILFKLHLLHGQAR